VPDHPRIPKYRLFKPKNLACVDIAGKRFYLGAYGSPESRQLYNASIADCGIPWPGLWAYRSQ
jgi:hypothetical protein